MLPVLGVNCRGMEMRSKSAPQRERPLRLLAAQKQEMLEGQEKQRENKLNPFVLRLNATGVTLQRNK